ncbi:Trigger factor [Frankliniella fusca]|uniref:Trigger factor n=1 Tax=Frankliniella fusca TaxID=407009 RepID=A0AAE1LHU9_9NEOP|nr:Trigger factor [Frankliniella fusca]
MAPLLQLEHVFDAQQGFVRPLIEGRLAIPNIVSVGVKSRRGDLVEIQAIVVPSTSINKDPFIVEIFINKKESVVEKKISEISCTCPGGACKSHCCKHAMAVIIHLERLDESEIDTLTCTETDQVWGQLKDGALSKFEAAPLDTFCHLPRVGPVYQREVQPVTDELATEFETVSLKMLENSQAAKCARRQRQPAPAPTPPSQRRLEFFNHVIQNEHVLVKRVQELSNNLLNKCTPAQQQYYRESVMVTKKEALSIFLDSTGQNNAVWDAARYGRVTGSICYELFTYYRNKNPDWNKKINAIFGPHFSNSNMEAGNFYEPYALKKYLVEENKTCLECIDSMQVGIVINPLLPWLGFSADAIIFKNREMFKLWENKTPVKGNTINALQICQHLSYIDRSTGLLKKKGEYYGQIQLGMVLLNLPACDFSIYCSGVAGKPSEPKSDVESIHTETIVLDQSFCLNLLETLCHVYFEKILPWHVERND